MSALNNWQLELVVQGNLGTRIRRQTMPRRKRHKRINMRRKRRLRMAESDATIVWDTEDSEDEEFEMEMEGVMKYEKKSTLYLEQLLMGAKLKREVMDLKERKTKMKRERMLKISPISVEKDIDERNNRGFCFSRGKRIDSGWATFDVYGKQLRMNQLYLCIIIIRNQEIDNKT